MARSVEKWSSDISLTGLESNQMNFCDDLRQDLIYGVHVFFVTQFGDLTVILLAVAVIACVLPARRPTQVNPVTALRAS